MIVDKNLDLKADYFIVAWDPYEGYGGLGNIRFTTDDIVEAEALFDDVRESWSYVQLIRTLDSSIMREL